MKKRYVQSKMVSELYVGACVLQTPEQKASVSGLDMVKAQFKSIASGKYVKGSRVHCSLMPPQLNSSSPLDSEGFVFQIPIANFDSAELALRIWNENGRARHIEFGRQGEEKSFVPRNQDKLGAYRFLKLRIVSGQEFKPLFVRIENLNLNTGSIEPDYFVFNAEERRDAVVVMLTPVDDLTKLPAFWQKTEKPAKAKRPKDGLTFSLGNQMGNL